VDIAWAGDCLRFGINQGCITPSLCCAFYSYNNCKIQIRSWSACIVSNQNSCCRWVTDAWGAVPKIEDCPGSCLKICMLAFAQRPFQIGRSICMKVAVTVLVERDEWNAWRTMFK